ncbi:MAG: glycosyltransferase [Chloroflexi bacterium]|nr:glycosyltransferase [Chloroflexota bacterium]
MSSFDDNAVLTASRTEVPACLVDRGDGLGPMGIAMVSVHGCPYIRAGEKDAGGMNVYVLETARELARRGARVDVFTRRHDLRDEQVMHLSPRARVIHLDAGPVSAEKEGVYEHIPEFCRALADFQNSEGRTYDLVSSHYWLSGLVGLDLARRWRVPHVTSFHTLAEVKRRARPGESEHPRRASSERQIACEADRIVVWSEHERNALVQLYQADPGRVLIIPPGVDVSKFRPLDQKSSRERLGLGDGRILLYVGRLERLKGVDILFRAVAALDDASDVRVIVIGGSANSPELSRLRRVAASLKIDGRVSFRGSLPQEQLPEFYSAADICVLPSFYESFGLAALEAAACGTPVVASRVGGLPTIVKDGETGYLVAWRCPGPFQERLEVLLRNENLRHQMGLAARRHAEGLSWELSGGKLCGLFQTMVAANRTG